MEKAVGTDNIMIERWFRSFKYEEAYLTLYNNIKEARVAIGRYSTPITLKDAILPLITKHRLNATTRQCFAVCSLMHIWI